MARPTLLRGSACVLLAIGSAAVVGAIMLPTYVEHRLAVTPLDIRTTTVAVTDPGTGGDVLDATSITRPGPLSVATGVPLVVQRFITTEDPSDADRVTFQSGATVRRADREGDAGLLTASVDRVTVDRRTSQPVDPVASLQTTVGKPAIPVPRTGYQQRFPFDTQPITYSVYDATAWTSFPAEFVEEISMDGLPIYHFRTQVTGADLSETTQSPINSVTLPASKWGLEGLGAQSITMKRYYSTVRDIYVEPRSGSLVGGREQPYQYFARDPAVPEVTVFKATLGLDEDGQKEQLDRARESATKLMWLTDRGPVLLWSVGGVGLVLGAALLVVSGRRSQR
ncbi:DUF3068 domain-containing protein [Rhodococcus sp. MEB041]|uniref:DUF3068 domain-containing protein n=1 Tax=Rhodococcus sp. MEB041 TaxID=3040323 RepID=UPI00254DCF78|nr:DUF3068 domain-containing protein [Rhodococcus sp. MEB041]